tara:strand:+ start:575615 stop:576109 length:495 start_codon:yes stop_codon:yes gene_type:complete
MTKYIKSFLLSYFAIFLMALPAHAQAQNTLVFAMGAYDILDDEGSLALDIEYRLTKPAFLGIKPFIGATLTTDKAAYSFGGLYKDFKITEKLFLTPSLAAGFYANGQGPDLDSLIQFRPMVDIGYRLNKETKISLGFSHISNGGLSSSNPGSEALMIHYHRAWP